MTKQPLALRLAQSFERCNYNHDHVMQAAAELRRLHAEVEALREANEAFGKRQEWWNEKMVQLESERDALRVDAERYRWIRRDATTLHDINELTRIVTDLCVDRMDSAIDAAMQRGQHGS